MNKEYSKIKTRTFHILPLKIIVFYAPGFTRGWGFPRPVTYKTMRHLSKWHSRDEYHWTDILKLTFVLWHQVLSSRQELLKTNFSWETWYSLIVTLVSRFRLALFNVRSQEGCLSNQELYHRQFPRNGSLCQSRNYACTVISPKETALWATFTAALTALERWDWWKGRVKKRTWWSFKLEKSLLLKDLH